MHHFTIGLLFFFGVDAVILHSHHHISRRFHGHAQTLDVFPRSSHALNAVDPLVYPTSRSSEQTQAQQVKRDGTDRDYARSTGVTPSSSKPGRGVDYLSDAGTDPAAQPAQSIPATESPVGAAPASASPPADQVATTSQRLARKKGAYDYSRDVPS